jgi:2'-5' RNA ligase
MQKLTQKYVIAHLVTDLPDGYEYSMADWPLHVTLADVFAIDGDPNDLLVDLSKQLSAHSTVKSEVVGEEWFGEDRSVYVKLLNKTDELQQLHETILAVLQRHNVKFNSPEYTKEGFRPHSTVQKNGRLELNDVVMFDSVTLIDMFPDENPTRRRILGTVHFS